MLLNLKNHRDDFGDICEQDLYFGVENVNYDDTN